MTGAVLALALAAAPPLPEGRARWRFELAGEHVGVVELAVACGADRCDVLWTSERRTPVETGGRRTTLRIEAEVDREGVWRGGKLRVVDDGGSLKTAGVAGAFPASLAELVLARRIPLPPRKGWQSALPPGPELCVDAFDEATGERGLACAHRDGDALAANVLGVAETVVPAPDGFAATVAIPQQTARFVRDAEATAPRRAPRLHGSAVAGPTNPAAAASFCGVPRDGEAGAADLGFLPAPRADGASCVEKTAAWLARAARAGLRGRTAIGVAWDGTRYVWHAWAEVRLERGWIPIDPSFGETPARGPRFTLAAYDPGDEAARLRAGERILACWGRERVRGREAPAR
ncbi:MAG TPA: transglutaminase domain-containing protein [Anaeromyxobacter sp.]|nr:transglutaminase domain-containing protein [Anaeromyxobacter sp.]